MGAFSVEVECAAAGEPHKHLISIESGKSEAYGAGPPPTIRLQYTCPVTGETLMASFKPPIRAARPFMITEVT